MASVASTHLLLVAVVVLAASTSVVRCNTGPVTVEEACKRYTKHASYCTSAMLAVVPGAAVPLPVLAEQAVLHAAQNGAAAVEFIKNLEKMAGGMPLECLDKCVGKFQAAVAALQKSREAIVEHKDVARVKAWVKAARADGETCMDGCHMMEGAADPTILHRITELGKLCSIALALADAAAHNAH